MAGCATRQKKEIRSCPFNPFNSVSKYVETGSADMRVTPHRHLAGDLEVMGTVAMSCDWHLIGDAGYKGDTDMNGLNGNERTSPSPESRLSIH